MTQQTDFEAKTYPGVHLLHDALTQSMNEHNFNPISYSRQIRTFDSVDHQQLIYNAFHPVCRALEVILNGVT
jgi:hypothetical protein